MKRPDPVEAALDELRGAEDVTPFLRHRSCRVVAKAATRAAPGAARELAAAFQRFLEDGAKQDPGCVAKLAIAKALVEMDEPAADTYLAGARHVQLEAGYGGSTDTAAELRGVCAIGLARTAHPEALLEAVRLLSDREPETRIGAMRAMADSGEPAAELVLRYKAASGDRKEEVMGECFAALLRLGPRGRAVAYVGEFLRAGDEEAAIALGESRLAEAWPVLRAAFEGSRIQSSILLAMALLRNDEAIAYLLDRVENDRERVAAVAIEAMAAYRGDQAIRGRIEEILGKKNKPELRKVFETYWR
jgi:HEAT repeat protein